MAFTHKEKPPKIRILDFLQGLCCSCRHSYSSSMSTDTEDDVGLTMEASVAKINLEDLSTVTVMLISANVGSIFEDPEALIPNWIDEVNGHLAALEPQFVAIHFQEVGGKSMSDGTQMIVQQFVKDFLERCEQLNYNRHCVYFDQNFKNPETFTALGTIYLIHDTIKKVESYNFKTRQFSELRSSVSHLFDLDSPNVTNLEKHKFPLRFFPESRWSRKGTLRSRWKLHGTPFDLINIHLFHDASNIVSMVDSAPNSIYCDYRRNALQYTLDRVHNDEHESLPYFIFGDFNFRLDGHSVLRKLTTGLSRRTSEMGLEYVNRSSQVILTIGKKEFHLDNHDEMFQSEWIQWKEYDQERFHVEERLSEFPLKFPPTYPFEEDPNEGTKYMRTRCPAWCDRVLFSHPTRELFDQLANAEYDVIGRGTCMGDHKPVYLQMHIKHNVSGLSIPTYSDYLKSSANSSRKTSPIKEKLPRVESPTYTDLLSNPKNPPDIEGPSGEPGCNRCIEMPEVNYKIKMFKETTV
ncbi:inositol polyphosphate-5-phosphatase A-like isoform X2 [Tigriopus californicus]|uniref:inositol polyphosphate-5-phosphatase A-like isoform X2 n=1 Tax=Tigriopus californicus TaxID=6832 RepID=UPI0027DA2A12|nr:inositol polyphosphate-5-phosphatase A-like isoform X2 [Tigriopus californicus]